MEKQIQVTVTITYDDSLIIPNLKANETVNGFFIGRMMDAVKYADGVFTVREESTNTGFFNSKYYTGKE